MVLVRVFDELAIDLFPWPIECWGMELVGDIDLDWGGTEEFYIGAGVAGLGSDDITAGVAVVFEGTRGVEQPIEGGWFFGFEFVVDDDAAFIQHEEAALEGLETRLAVAIFLAEFYFRLLHLFDPHWVDELPLVGL